MIFQTISILLPLEGKINVDFYNSFVSQYSVVIGSNFVLFEMVEKLSEPDAHELLSKYHGQIPDYSRDVSLLSFMHIQFDPPQIREIRGLDQARFFLSVTNGETTAKSILKHFLNYKEFLLLYSIFEGTLKSEFSRVKILQQGEYLKEKDMLAKLKISLESQVKCGQFIEILSSRSCFIDFCDIECFWDFFTHLRHLYAHTGGYVTQQWLVKYHQKEKSLNEVIGKFESFHALKLYDELEKTRPVTGKMFYMTDFFSGMFRYFVVAVMESLYLHEVA